jgi:hypothetical protein
MTTEYELSIDKISITVNDPDIERVKNICRHLQQFAETDLLDRYAIKPSRWRFIECSIPIPISSPHSSNRVRFEVGARHSGHPDYRLEFNPSKIGAQGIAESCDFLGSIAGIRLDGIIANGIVTRIDLAMDLYDLSLDEVIARSRGAQKIGVYTDRRGNPESTILGSPRSNRTVIYNKVFEDGRQSVRVERRMKPRCAVHHLATLPDPFRNVQLIGTDSFLPFLDGMVAEHFFDSVRIRGVSRAVNNLPPGPRRAIKAMLRDPAVSILPSTEQVWRGWPKLLVKTGFGPFLIPVIDPEATLVPEMVTEQPATFDD